MLEVLNYFNNSDSAYAVQECHPTTSSGYHTKKTPNTEQNTGDKDKGHDLVLVSNINNTNPIYYYIEISDVMGKGNNDKKIDKDFCTLLKKYQKLNNPPSDSHQFFIACSNESKEHLETGRKRQEWKNTLMESIIKNPVTNLSPSPAWMIKLPMDELCKSYRDKCWEKYCRTPGEESNEVPNNANTDGPTA